MLLIQMHKLETLNLFWGSKVNLGSFGVIGVKFWFSLKMHYLLCYQVYSCNSYTCITFAGKQGNWGQSGVDVSKPAGYAVCDGNMSSSFFLSFFLTMIASSSTCLIGCLPNLVRSMCGCMATKLMGLKIHPGSYGVTEVKNVNHVKNMKTAPIQNLIMSSCRQ